MEIVTIIISAALTVITGGFLRRISKVVKDVRSAFLTLQDAQRATLRDRIVQGHDYFTDKGCIGKYSLSSLEDMYDNYTKLDGNGFVHGLMDDIRELPLK